MASTEAFKFDTGSNEYNRNPVAYVSDTRGRVSAVIETNCTSPIFIGARSEDGFILPPVEAVPVPGSSGKLMYPETAFDQLFEDGEVKYFPYFKLNWYVTEDTDSDVMIEVGSSNHPLYVLHDFPLQNQSGTPVYFEHSLIDIACRGSHDMSDPDNIVDGIFEDFTDQCVKKYKSEQCMFFWGDNWPAQTSDVCFNYQALLAYEDNTCGSWADLFANTVEFHGLNGFEKAVAVPSPNPDPVPNQSLFDSIRTQLMSYGIISSSNDNAHVDVELFYSMDDAMTSIASSLGIDINSAYLIFRPTVFVDTLEGIAYTLVLQQLMIKKWDFSNLEAHNIIISEIDTSDMSRDISRPGSYVEIPDLELINDVKIPNIATSDLSAQGVSHNRLRSEFENHIVIKKGDKIFDPSYGMRFPDKSTWERESIAAYAMGIRFDIPANLTTDGSMKVGNALIPYEMEEGAISQTLFIIIN